MIYTMIIALAMQLNILENTKHVMIHEGEMTYEEGNEFYSVCSGSPMIMKQHVNGNYYFYKICGDTLAVKYLDENQYDEIGYSIMHIQAEGVILETTLLESTADELTFLNEFIGRSEVKCDEPFMRFQHGDTTLLYVQNNSDIYFKMTVTE